MKISKRVKRIFSLVLAFVLLMSTNMQVMFADESQAAEVSVLVSGNHPNATAKMVNYYDTVMDGEIFAVESTIGSKVKGFNVQNSNENAQFLGWKVCIKSTVTDDGGNPIIILNSIDEKLYSMDEILNYVIPAGYTELYLQAQWQDNSFVPMTGVEFWSNYPGVQITLTKTDGQTLVAENVGSSFNAGSTVGSQVTVFNIGNEVALTGWKVYAVEYAASSDPNQRPEIVNQTLITTLNSMSELLAYEVPSNYQAIAFEAQWDETLIPSGPSNPDGTQNASVEFELRDGTITLFTGGPTNGFGEPMVVGDTVEENLLRHNDFIGHNATVADPVYWTTNRTFAGWKVFHLVDVNGVLDKVEVPNVGTLTTAQVMDYEVQAQHTIFEAQWSGNDADYYTDIVFWGFGEKITFEVEMWENGKLTKVELEGEAFGDAYRELGDGVRWQMDNLSNIASFKAEPVKANATLEGWLEFRMHYDSNGNEVLTPVSDKLFTTNEMLTRPIPKDDTQYVAKWSDIPLNQYPGFGQGMVQIDVWGNGGDITLTGTWHNGTTTASLGDQFPIGSTLRQNGIEFADPVPNSHNTGWTFAGWRPYQWTQTGTDENGDPIMDPMPVPNSKVMTTAEVLDYEFGTEQIILMAQWNIGNQGGGNSGGSVPGHQENLFMYAGGGNFNYKFYDENNKVVEKKGMGIFTYDVAPDKAFKQCMDERGDGLTAVYKACGRLAGWEIYTCDDVEFLHVPAGSDPAIGDPDLTMIYLFESNGKDCWVLLTNAVKENGLQSTSDVYNLSGAKEHFVMAAWDEAHTPGNITTENTVDPVDGKDGSYEKVDYCKVCHKELSRVKETIKVQTVTLSGALAGKTGSVETKPTLVEIPEGVKEKYDTVEEIQEEMVKKSQEANKNLADDKKEVKTQLLDVELKVQKEDGTWEKVTGENFPAEGITFLLTYEELGITDPDKLDFVITHMITHGAKAGEVEVLSYTREANGLRVKVTSLSPIMVSSVGKEEAPWYGWYVPSNPSATTDDAVKSPKTGDSNMMIYLVMFAVAGVAVTTVARKRVR